MKKIRRCDFKGFQMGCIRSAGSNHKAIFPHLSCLVGSLDLVLPSLDSLLVVFTNVRKHPASSANRSVVFQLKFLTTGI